MCDDTFCSFESMEADGTEKKGREQGKTTEIRAICPEIGVCKGKGR